MKFKHNVFNYLTALMFLLAFVFLMLSYATQVMYIPSMIFFEAGFIMLTVVLIRSGVAKQKEQDERQEVIVMELASSEDGEAYVMQTENNNKKLKRKKRSQKFERFMPAMFTIIASALILYMLVSGFIRIIK